MDFEFSLGTPSAGSAKIKRIIKYVENLCLRTGTTESIGTFSERKQAS